MEGPFLLSCWEGIDAMLQKTYEPWEVEEKWSKWWVDRKIFHSEVDYAKKPFSVVIPPPNVTGSLHMGHALNVTIQDIVVRMKKMQGFNVMWLPGTDHAGIATQNVVERSLASKGVDRRDIGRDRFIEEVWKWKEQYGNTIINQLKRLGVSCDWDRLRFTMDEGLSRAVKEVFVKLYEEGLIYRDKYIVNWCPRCHTALSDIEVEYEEEDSILYYVKYPFVDGSGYVVVATVRPETILGDVAVAVHPRDERYRDLIGKRVRVPLTKREVEIIEDNYVDPSFGTGALKVTPAHDPNDFLIAERHSLPKISILTSDAKMSAETGKYAGLDRFEARKVIVEDLYNSGLMEKEEPYKHAVGRCYRCKTVVEPYLSEQWFVKIRPLADMAVKVVEDEKVKFYPEHWKKIYYEWMNNIRDWCISRQIWWGHRIPVWYCEDCGHLNVSTEEPRVCEKCGSKNLHRDEDVLDTWFSSALWPFSTLGWPDDTDDLRYYYPTSLLVTGFDILFFWVARMIMMGTKFMGKEPFRDVYIHALVRDEKGKKMSKSYGNVIDPLDMIREVGADALRFTLAYLAIQGRDIKLSKDRIKTSRNFMNKLWNAARFVLSQLEEYNYDEGSLKLDIADRWILSRLQKTIEKETELLESYSLGEAVRIVYNFVWKEYCDWYLEIAKVTLYNSNDEERLNTVRTVLREILKDILKMLHPVVPFITEEIWHHLETADNSIVNERWPVSDKNLISEEVEDKFSAFQEIVRMVRNIRAEMSVPPNKDVSVYIRTGEDISVYLPYLKRLAKIGNLYWGEDVNRPPRSAAGVTSSAEVFVELKGVVDFEKETDRLRKSIAKIEKELSAIEGRLNNKGFLENASPDVIEEHRNRFEELKQKLSRLKDNLDAINVR